jgi:hypothetical protein
MLRRSLAIGEKTLGKDHPELSFTLLQIADAYRGLAQIDRARAALERTCKLREHGPPLHLSDPQNYREMLADIHRRLGE